jgi:hypothetical protein
MDTNLLSAYSSSSALRLFQIVDVELFHEAVVDLHSDRARLVARQAQLHPLIADRIGAPR